MGAACDRKIDGTKNNSGSNSPMKNPTPKVSCKVTGSNSLKKLCKKIFIKHAIFLFIVKFFAGQS